MRAMISPLFGKRQGSAGNDALAEHREAEHADAHEQGRGEEPAGESEPPRRTAAFLRAEVKLRDRERHEIATRSPEDEEGIVRAHLVAETHVHDEVAEEPDAQEPLRIRDEIKPDRPAAVHDELARARGAPR